MVRTQLYLQDETYKFAKKQAVKRKMSFAAYTRFLYEKEMATSKKKMTIQEKKYPFIGMFKWGRGAADNEKIDEFLMDEAYGKYNR